MEFNQSTFKGFFEKYAVQIRDKDFIRKSYSCFEEYPLLPSQAIYVFDFQEMNIPYQREVKRLLGYDFNDFNAELFNHLYHPDDYDRYLHLIKISNEWVRKLKPEPFTIEASFDYRVRKKDGSYLKILRQSTVFETCLDKSMKSSFSILSDISRIKKNTSVNLSFIDLNTGRIILEDNEDKPDKIHFTEREKEILLKIKKGLDSKTIAQEFECSKHTVDTHRRNMLQKAGCKNTIELIDICTRNGII
ncbi:MAG: LuxR C-terminal-related transcriptional regulator [Bacteroidales bacterium]|nr:LuxR C-terminal-related transcriptional regulator [Bacteroidales bacterium]